jgi:rRNA maturation endonuclease Nob1
MNPYQSAGIILALTIAAAAAVMAICEACRRYVDSQYPNKSMRCPLCGWWKNIGGPCGCR